MGSGPIYQIHSPFGDYWSKSLLGLIEGIYVLNPTLSRKILREWIECSNEPTFLEKEITKVAAKRIRRNEALQSKGTELFRPALSENFSPPSDTRVRYESDRDVHAQLFSKDGVLLCESSNTNGKIRTQHAEMNLIDRLGRKLPKGSRLVVSLKPCRMCAARIWEAASDIRDFQVIYKENDPGPLAQETILDTDSAARLRVFGKKSDFFSLKIQSQA